MWETVRTDGETGQRPLALASLRRCLPGTLSLCPSSTLPSTADIVEMRDSLWESSVGWLRVAACFCNLESVQRMF